MNISIKNSLKARRSNNPTPAILELIPYTETVIDPKLLDQMAMEFKKSGVDNVNNSATMLLLSELSNVGLVEITCNEFPGTLGRLFIIKRTI